MDHDKIEGAGDASAPTGKVLDLSGAAWRKSTWSMGNGDCVEFARLAPGYAAVRDSKHKAGPPIVISARDWRSFIHEVKSGKLDHL
jgi:Domain of unknown function (DUF397)